MRLVLGLIGVASLIMLILFALKIENEFKKERTTFTRAMIKLMEASYGEGQADALKNDIRIKMINDTTFIWIKSPWNDKSYIPKDTVKISK